MKRIFTKLLFSLLFTVILLSVSAVFAQEDEIEKKRIEAQRIYQEAIKLREENTFNSYNLAFAKFQAAAKIFAEIDDKNNLGRCLLGSGLVKDLAGESGETVKFYEQALELFRAAGNKNLQATTLSNLGKLYSDLGDNRKALEFQKQSLILRKEVGDRSGEALTMDFLGLIYNALGERQKALSFFEQSLTIHKELSEFKALANTFSNIGLVYLDLGENEKAVENLNKSLTLRKFTSDKNGEAVTLNNLGLAFDALKRYAKAIENYNKALAIFTVIGLENRKATIFNNLSAVHISLGNYEISLEHSRQALAIHQKEGDQDGQATVLNNIGNALMNLNDYKPALENLNQALLLAKFTENKNLEAIILGNLMQTHQRNSNIEAAIFYGKQTVNNYQQLRQNIAGLDQSTQQIYLQTIEDKYRFLADLLIEAGKFAQAEQILRMLKKEEYFDFVRRDAGEIKSLNQRVKLTEKEQELIKRYTILADTVVQIGAEFQKLDAKKRQLSRIDSVLSAEEQTRYETLSAQIRDANAAFKLFLDKQLSEELGKTVARKIEFDRSLQSKLAKWEKGTVVLHTVATENRYRVILTTPIVQTDGKTEIKIADLNKKIFAFREVLQDAAIDPRPIGKQLYDILIKPIEKDLQAAGAKTLVWSLDGTLRYIPLSALSPDGKTYLAEKFQNVILTAKTADDLSDANAEWRALGVGVSEASSVIDPANKSEKINFTALPAAKNELTKIIRDEISANESGILTGRRLLDKDFTLKSFADLLTQETADGKRKFSVVHLASHFRLGNDWSSSFLLLGDGKILTLEEISSSPQINFGDVELVTLSACNTAFADDANGKEIDSLAEAIQTKSGKAILATLWAVSDESTALLMSEFYRLRKENPQLTKSEAMQTAQKSLIDGTLKFSPDKAKLLKPNIDFSENKTDSPAFQFDENKPFAHPFYWSPFILIGNWR